MSRYEHSPYFLITHILNQYIQQKNKCRINYITEPKIFLCLSCYDALLVNKMGIGETKILLGALCSTDKLIQWSINSIELNVVLAVVYSLTGVPIDCLLISCKTNALHRSNIVTQMLNNNKSIIQLLTNILITNITDFTPENHLRNRKNCETDINSQVT